MPAFQNRTQQIMEICALDNQPRLLNIYGEAGIGKSRMLQEASDRLRTAYTACLVLLLDFARLAKVPPADRARHLILELIDKADGRLRDIPPLWTDVDKTISQVVLQLIDLSMQVPVFLMCDTTEKVQEDKEFWQWMEAELVGPLTVEGQVRQVFAGRVPIPWRRIEIRRIVVQLPLHPLSVEKVTHEDMDQDEVGAATRLVREALYQQNTELRSQTSDTNSDLIALILSLSFGHPKLSLELAHYAAGLWPDLGTLRDFRVNSSTDIVRSFIDQELFEGVEYPWNEILWWVSILDWFDATLLQRYLSILAPELVDNEPDYFFIQGISSLRRHHTVLWREAQGDQLQGTIRDIVQRCMEISRPESYRKACLAAAKTFAQLSEEFEKGSPDSIESVQFARQAETYRRRLEKEEPR